MQNWFPLGVAKGKAFCNRIEERKRLKYNILNNTHTLIISPRRYGKTSLAQQVITELKFPSCTIEFTLASDRYTAQNIIHTAVGRLLINLMPTHKKAFSLATKYFAKLSPSFVLDTQSGARIEFKPDLKSTELGLTELLENIDKAAREAKKRIILFMDEFQQLATFDDHQIIEAAIRNAAQRMENACFIFSGSNRHLLQLMFDDTSRPLFHLCDRITPERISEKDYIDYIEKAALDRWKKSLSIEVIKQIFELTQRHPYYLNVLCARLWREEQLPVLKNIEIFWNQYITEENYRIANELNKLSHHQKLMLMILSQQPFSQPTSKEVVTLMRSSVGSAAKSCKILLENDYIYQDVDGYYKILDPAIFSYLQKESKTILGL